MDPFVEPHLNWRPVEGDDWVAVTELQAQVAIIDEPLVTPVLDLLESLPEGSERGIAVGGWDDYGSLLAFAWNHVDPDATDPLVHLLGTIHPTHRHLGIGANLLQWQIDRAVEWRDVTRPGEPLRLQCFVEGNPAQEQLLVQRGFRLIRCLADMTRPLHPLPSVQVPQGVELVEFSERFSQEVLALHRVCFEAPFCAQRWAESLSAPSFRADWSLVALRDKRLIGYCLNGLVSHTEGEEDQGWCDRLGVAPEERGHGIAEAMLARSMRAMAADGIQSCGISVDVPSRGISEWLTRVLGYVECDSVASLELVID